MEFKRPTRNAEEPDVIQSLRQSGKKIWRLKDQNIRHGGESYSVSGEFLSAAHLLVMANKARKSAGKPIFFVEGMSEF